MMVLHQIIPTLRKGQIPVLVAQMKEGCALAVREWGFMSHDRNDQMTLE